MKKTLEQIGHLVGNTPLLQLEDPKVQLFTKLEFQNLMGSVKMRTAYYILKSAIERGEIDEDTTIIESSSGNFAIALGTLCKRLGIRFMPVIDPNIAPIYEDLLRTITDDVVKVTERDHTGGFLITRLEMIKQLQREIPHCYWTNQYGNLDNFKAHYYGLGQEIADHFDELDYAFIGVSSGGTISGTSARLKEKFPNIKIVAVDSEGSVIFGGAPKKRYIPGIGSSIVPDLLKKAVIDEVIHVPEYRTVQGCRELYAKHAIFAGGSSGTSFYAIQQYFADKEFATPPRVVFLCHDGGMAYVNTVYNDEWVKRLAPELNMI